MRLATRDPGEVELAAGRRRGLGLPRILEGAAIAIATLAVAFLAIALLSGFFTGQDQPGFTGADTGPGIAFRDLGHAHLQLGQPHPPYNSHPPTSGAHMPDIPTSNGAELTNDQLLEVLELGDVVIMYGSPTPPSGLQTLARQVAPPFNPALVATGDQLIFAHRPGTNGLVGLAWAHMIHTTSPADPMLKVFARYWIGRGAPGG